MHGDVSQPAERNGDDRHLILGRFGGFSMLLPREEGAALAGSGEPVEGRVRTVQMARSSVTHCEYLFPRAMISSDIGAVTIVT